MKNQYKFHFWQIDIAKSLNPLVLKLVKIGNSEKQNAQRDGQREFTNRPNT